MEDSSFKTVRKGLIVICLLIISLFLLKIEISSTKLSLPFLGGARIIEPVWIFPIIYSFLVYYSWKYTQYLFAEHDEGNLIRKAVHDFFATYSEKYIEIAKKEAEEEIGKDYLITKFEKLVCSDNGITEYNFWIRDRTTGEKSLFAVYLRIPIAKNLFHHITTKPEFTILFLPIILLIYVIYITTFPTWDGGLALCSYLASRC